MIWLLVSLGKENHMILPHVQRGLEAKSYVPRRRKAGNIWRIATTMHRHLICIQNSFSVANPSRSSFVLTILRIKRLNLLLQNGNIFLVWTKEGRYL